MTSADKVRRLGPLKLVVSDWATSIRLIERVYFFGSRVRGEYRSDSDLDIAVQLTTTDPDEAVAQWTFECDKWTVELATLIPFQVDLQLLHMTATPTVVAGIARASLLVYARQV
ncbi:MAG: nucleotidyltransferase domain-containing protein [Hylemonella sp.]|nr:nucleotidyltransferase domain-containing protein [Hylemonella sp.]